MIFINGVFIYSSFRTLIQESSLYKIYQKFRITYRSIVYKLFSKTKLLIFFEKTIYFPCNFNSQIFSYETIL